MSSLEFDCLVLLINPEAGGVSGSESCKPERETKFGHLGISGDGWGDHLDNVGPEGSHGYLLHSLAMLVTDLLPVLKMSK